MRSKNSFLIGMLVSALFLSESASAATTNLFLSPGGNDSNNGWNCQDPAHPCRRVSHAVDLINGNANITEGIIHLEAGAYEDFSPVDIQKNTTLTGAGIDVSFVQMSFSTSNSPLFMVSELTLTTGSTFSEDLMATQGTVALDKVRVAGEYRLRNDGASFNITNSSFEEQSEIWNDSGFFAASQISITNLASSALGIWNKGVMSIQNSDISFNNDLNIRNNGTMTITSSSFMENRGYGPLIENSALPNASASLLITHSTIGRNELKGQSIIANGKDMTVQDSSFYDNRTFFGNSPVGNGIINSSGPLTVRRSRFSSNYAAAGGAIRTWNSQPLLIEDSTFTGNSSIGGGGALSITGGSAVISNSTFSNNSAFSAPGYAPVGGAIHVTKAIGSPPPPPPLVILNQSTIAHNRAGSTGGGIAVTLGGLVKLRNTTVANNTIGLGIGGGGLSTTDGGTIEVKNSIIALNTFSATGALSDCNGNIQSARYNLDSDHSCNLTSVGDKTSANPQLDVLGNYGGLTQTLRLLGGPAVDAGDPNGCAGEDHLGNSTALKFDQRGMGFKRHFDAGSGSNRCDMGAFEAQDKVYSGD